MAEQQAHDSQRWWAELARRSARVSEALNRRIGPGAPLSAPERATFEGRLGGDLSSALVHRSPLAGHLARTLDAEAVTAGSHILGGAAELDSESPDGAALLGHELTHVVQRDLPDLDETGEANAQLIERELESDLRAVASSPGGIDTEVLAERVYKRMWDELRRERDRGGWVI